MVASAAVPSFTVVVLVLGVIALLIDRVADARGWSRSSKNLRVENLDLLRRNQELEVTVARHEGTIASQGAKIDELAARVALLSERDQAAVLAQLKVHETKAEARTDKTISLLTDIRDTLKRETA